MSVLLAVVDAGSLSAAGRNRGMPLATVSRKISELQAALKTQLLIRSTRQLTLTESGRGCRSILGSRYLARKQPSTLLSQVWE